MDDGKLDLDKLHLDDMDLGVGNLLKPLTKLTPFLLPGKEIGEVHIRVKKKGQAFQDDGASQENPYAPLPVDEL